MRSWILGVALLCSWGVSAQGVNNVRINEVLVVNENNYEDGYGHRSSWIELFNSGYEAVNVGQCYLEVEREDGTVVEYRIPGGDPATKMSAQTYLVFFCEGTGTKGTFYTNFTLEGVRKISLYTAGRNVIDEFVLDPAAQVADVSVGKGGSLARTTPGATNVVEDGISHSEEFRQKDPRGGVMAIIAMSVVFSALVLIFFVLKLFGAAMQRVQAKPAAEVVVPRRKPATDQVAEEMAAIGLALKLYQEEQHILESTVITINRASRVYSPWSSKIHGIPKMPR